MSVPGPPSGEAAQDALAAIRDVPAPFRVVAGGSVAETDDLQRSRERLVHRAEHQRQSSGREFRALCLRIGGHGSSMALSWHDA